MFIIDFICGLLGSIIRVIFNIFGQNYFVALLIFTFLTKLILFPLMLKQLKSTAALQKIAPEDRRLREKYKDNPEKLSQELGKLYTENKIKPLGGCIIPLIQIPIVLAMFWVVKQPLTYITQTDPAVIESYTQEYLGKEEVTESEMNEYEINIAKKYDLLDMNIGFGLNLGDTPKDAFSNDGNNRVSKLTLIIPLLTLVFAIISNKISQRKMQMTEDQAEMQKSMNLVMPLLSTYIAFAWPIALGVYWLFGSVLGIIQQLVIDKIMEKESGVIEVKGKKKKDKVLFLGKGDNNND